MHGCVVIAVAIGYFHSVWFNPLYEILCVREFVFGFRSFCSE